ncbi:MAG: T9SS type A sorting domain-containing protein [Bacteroidales bacterium]|nr:T9SS type A sorting domain-containing protein [Bacteroidales bacterium]
MSNGSVSFTVGGAAATTAKTDQIVTLIITPASGYGLDELTVTNDATSESVTVTGNTFTMPASDITVTASFKVAHNLTFYVNGTIKEIRAVEDGNQIGTLPTLTAGETPDGFELVGWIAGENYFNATTAPASYIKATDVPTGDATYTAVFAQYYDASLVTGELTESEITANITNNTCAYGTEKSYEDKSDNITWTASCYTDAASRKWMQLKSSNDVYIKIEAPNNIRSVEVVISSTSNGSGGINTLSMHTAFSGTGTIYLRTTAAGTGVGSLDGSDVSSYIATINPSGNNKTLYLQVSAGARIWGLTVKHAPKAYKNYTTIVTNESIGGEVTDLRIFESISATADVTNNGTIHIFDGGVLDMGAYNLTNTTAANLVIEDGGQLITTSTGVAATVKSHILAATAKDVSNWYLISSPVKNPTLSTATNLLEGTYDFFRYNEAEGKWENQKTANGGTGFTAMTTGLGYLYRNSAAMDITYRGEVNVAASQAVTISGSGDLQGFNLIGNPYTHDIYKGAGTAIPNSKTDDYALGTGFYTLKSDGTWDTGTDNTTAIKPGQGLLVKASKAGTIVIGNTNAKAAKSNNDNIMFKVENSEYTDVAYAWFDKGVGLDKINHRNAEAPMLYINQEGVNYGIATMSDDTKSFNLNFKAMTMGKYTLSYKAKGNFSYLHVIDRLTGNDVDMLLEGEYSFIAAPGDNENRFIVVLEYLEALETLDGTFAYQNGNDIIVNGEGNLQIFDVMGRLIASQGVNGVETVNVSITGVYIFKLNEKTQKIVVR